MAAALLVASPETAQREIDQRFPAQVDRAIRDHYGVLFRALLALERGDPHGAWTALDRRPWTREYSQLAVAGAIAAALDPAASRDERDGWIAATRAGCGPVYESLLTVLADLQAARDGTAGPPAPDVVAALARQDAAGREHLVELLLARWAHRVADEAARVRGGGR